VSRRAPGRSDWRPAASAAAGASAGLILASARFGLGFEALVVPPFDLLAAGSERPWSTASAGEIALLYELPVLVGAGLALVAVAVRWVPRPQAALLAWLAFSAGWWAFSLGHETVAPVAALSLPAILVLARPAALGLRATEHVDRRVAVAGVATVAVLLALTWAVVADWARVERAGDARDWALVVIFLAGAGLAVAAALYARAGAALVLLASALGVAVLAAGTARIATGAADPIVSPQSPEIARQLRDRARAVRTETGLDIVVHPDIEDDLVWPFRDSGVIVVASRVGPNAGFVIWPAAAAAPDGFRALDGSWALTRTIRAPTADPLDYLHWLFDRNTLAPRAGLIAVYVRETE
jgi:hypothetical protein